MTHSIIQCQYRDCISAACNRLEGVRQLVSTRRSMLRHSRFVVSPLLPCPLTSTRELGSPVSKSTIGSIAAQWWQTRSDKASSSGHCCPQNSRNPSAQAPPYSPAINLGEVSTCARFWAVHVDKPRYFFKLYVGKHAVSTKRLS